jgi:hypothetical protein
MRITINPILDMETLTWVSNDGVYDYDGPFALFKGDDTAKAAEQQQSSFDNQLMSIFNAQYASQKSSLDYLTAKMMPMIENPTGYSNAELASMRTAATDTTAQQYTNAQAALNNQVSQNSGGSKLTGVSGAVTESTAALLNAKAQSDAAAQENITSANANLKQQNYWNAVNTLNGVAAETNPLGYSSAATQGSGAVSGLSQAYTASNQSQLLGALGGIAGGVGSALGGYFTGKCHLAAEIFGGWFKPETIKVRTWLHTIFNQTWYGKVLVDLYDKHSQWMARKPAIVWALTPLFKMVAE